MQKRKPKLKIILFVFVSLLILLSAAFSLYVSDYYRADASAAKTLQSSSVKVESSKNITVFYPDKTADLKIGLIYYPGGKVEDKAYSPLLESLAKKGITCVLIKMPFNLAVFNINAAGKVFSDFPEINSWYIGGHSLGGAMASSYAANNSAKLKGLILLAAYPVKAMQIPLLTIYGSLDGVLNRSKLQNTGRTVVIEGGNHAYFGNYGEQKGDGKASISREKQQAETVNAVVSFIANQNN